MTPYVEAYPSSLLGIEDTYGGYTVNRVPGCTLRRSWSWSRPTCLSRPRAALHKHEGALFFSRTSGNILCSDNTTCSALPITTTMTGCQRPGTRTRLPRGRPSSRLKKLLLLKNTIVTAVPFFVRSYKYSCTIYKIGCVTAVHLYPGDPRLKNLVAKENTLLITGAAADRLLQLVSALPEPDSSRIWLRCSLPNGPC